MTVALSPLGASIRDVARTVNLLIRGKSNNVTNITLTANTASTILSFADIESTSFVGLTPLTANAATALTNIYISSQSAGALTLSHANNAQTDRSFKVTIIG